MNDLTSLRAKEEVVALDYYMSILQGEHKKHFGALMSQYGDALDSLEEKGRIEREDALEIASLNNALEIASLILSVRDHLIMVPSRLSKIRCIKG